MTNKTSRNLLIFAGFVALSTYAATRRKFYSFKGKTALITGGSRGLGLSLAWNLLEQGAQVALIARDQDELTRAKKMLLASFPLAQVLTCKVDVTDRAQLQHGFQEVIDQFGAVDLLVNNAGAIVVGPFAAMEREDFEAQMRLHFFAVLDAVQIAMPHFKKRGGGRILNICSLGGKVGVPHMSPYDASKFALAGFAQGVQSELALQGVRMTTAFPPVMRTGSPIQAVFKGDQRKEFKVFETLDNMPILSMSADKAAKRILLAVAEGKTEVVPSWAAKARVIMGAAFPELMNWVMGIGTRFLPRDASKARRTGADSTSRRKRSDDEIMYNQKRRHDAEYSMGLDSPSGPVH